MQSISSGREAHICFQGRHITISDVSLEICNNYRTDIVLDDYGSQIASLPAGGGLDLELRGQVTDISTNEVGIVNPALSHTSDEMPVYPSGIDSSSNLVARIFGFLDIAVPPATEKQTEDETNKRAERLLISHLDPEQKEEYQNKGYFHVNTQGYCYRIMPYHTFNIWRIIDGVGDRVGRPKYCLNDPTLPVPDLMLAQKMVLEANHDYFILTANSWEF